MDTTIKQKNNINDVKNNDFKNHGPRRDGNDRKSRSFFEKPKPEFDQKMVSIRRVTRVVAGGRRMTFAVAIAIGDKKGSIGLGTGKGGDTAIAINKAIRQAKKKCLKLIQPKKCLFPMKSLVSLVVLS
jgi:ribosomal protein S5